MAFHKKAHEQNYMSRKFCEKETTITFSFQRTDLTNLLFRVNTVIVTFPADKGEGVTKALFQQHSSDTKTLQKSSKSCCR